MTHMTTEGKAKRKSGIKRRRERAKARTKTGTKNMIEAKDTVDLRSMKINEGKLSWNSRIPST